MTREPEKITVDRRRVPLRQALPLPGGHLAGRGRRPRRRRRPGEDINWLEDIELLEEDGMPGGVRPLLELVPARSTSRSRRAARTRSRARCSSSTCSRATPTASGSRRRTRSSRSPSSARGSRARAPSATTGRPRCSRAGSAAALIPILGRAPGHRRRRPRALDRVAPRAQRGEDVLVVDKTGVAAGASGIACGVVRNNYFQPAMEELMAACVEIWESDPEAFCTTTARATSRSGRRRRSPTWSRSSSASSGSATTSELIVGEAEVAAHMRALYPDWRAPGLSVCLHEHRGGFAFNRESMLGLADKARAAGAADRRGRRGHRLRARRSRRGDAVVDDRRGRSRSSRSSSPSARGSPRCGSMLGLPGATSEAAGASSASDVDLLVPAGGRGRVDPRAFVHRRRQPSPVLHVDCRRAAARRRRASSSPTSRGASTSSPTATASRAAPRRCRSGREFEVDPYPTGTVDPGFPDLWCAALSHCLGALRGRPRPLPPGALRRRRRVHGRQLPGLRPHARRTSTWPRTPTTATR